MKVLFVQEEPLLAAALKLTLLKQGYEMVFCKNAANAISYLNSTPTDLVIADVLLSVDGARLVSTAKLRNIPVIILSAQNSEDQLQQAFELEADDFASLPLSLPELSLRVSKLTRYKSTA